MKRIARVFPRITKMTPTDELVFTDTPPMFLPEMDEVHISVAFTYDMRKAEWLARQWEAVGVPVKMGGPAFNEPGGEFVPGMYLKKGYVITSRGCPNRCLHGETLIKTLDGEFPLKDLIGKNIKVLTRTKENNPIFADAINIRKTGENEQIMRVRFDNGSYLDCTPDHLLKTFKNGNQFIKLREYDTRADMLKIGDSVVSIHSNETSSGYIEITYGRRKRILLHRLIMEFQIGRKLVRREYVHHINRNKKDNRLSNLMLVDKKDHFKNHPEISQRMKLYNPTRNMTEEWREKVRIAGKGSKRTSEQRLKYRRSKLGPRNPNYKGGLYVNHKVVGIEYLPKKSDTYCMEVPGYDWFFTNDILVHNCWFCAVPERKGGLRELEVKDGWNVLDDNLLACSDDHIRKVFDMLSRQDRQPEFTGGLEAKRLKPWHTKRLKEIKTKRMYFAYDTPDDYEPLVHAGKILQDAGFKTSNHNMHCYVLIGYKGDTFEKAEKRLRATVDAGFVPYAMLYRDQGGQTDIQWNRFQREWLRPEIVIAKMLKIANQ